MDQIILSDDGIFVQIDKWLIQPTEIHKDENGFYFQEVTSNSSQCSWPNWGCVRCGYCNHPFEECCLVCEHDKKGRKCK